MQSRTGGWILCLLWLCAGSEADETILAPQRPSLSPDGKTVAFGWRGDLWSASSEGGLATRLTAHAGIDERPSFSPNGRSIAFTSDRTGTLQTFTIGIDGRKLEQRTVHSEGARLQGWHPDGKSLLVLGERDDYWYRAFRLYRKGLELEAAPQRLFNGRAWYGRYSPDRRRVAIMREGGVWTRKGYRGSRAAQIWVFDTQDGSFQRLSEGAHEERWPIWSADGKRIYFVSPETGTENLWRMNADGSERVQLTKYTDDGVVFPAISGDGKTIVFRRLFDLYRFHPNTDEEPKRISLHHRGDAPFERTRRRVLRKADQAAFSGDGREVAFIAGGDVWVMDTELKEPRRVTNTPEEERDPAFSPDFGTLVFVSDKDGQPDIWRAKRADEKRYWWQNEEFKLRRLTDDPAPERRPRFTPDGERIFFSRLRGDIWSMAGDGAAEKRIVESWNQPSFDLSPDGKWIAYAISDDDYNWDIYIRPADGSGEAVNVTRHPHYESDPVWSPDGKMLAFLGWRTPDDDTSDIYFIWLTKADDETDKRDRTLEKALKKMKEREKAKKKEKEKKAPAKTEPDPKQEKPQKPEKKEENGKPKAPAPDEGEAGEKEKEKGPVVTIDFEGISDRIRRITVEDSDESELMWSPDSKKLAFVATVGGVEGLYTVEVPDELKPVRVAKAKGTGGRWLKEGNQIVWLVKGVPTSMTDKGKATAYGFRIPVEEDRAARHLAAFDMCWRTMRDRFYDARMGNRDWDAIRRKYRPLAKRALTTAELADAVNLMLGELNASHLGFRANSSAGPRPAWVESTAHFGLRFDPEHTGPGLHVRDVVKQGPADRAKSRILPGETITRIDGSIVAADSNVATLTTGRLDRDVTLIVLNQQGDERKVVLRPVSFGAIRRLLYDQWIEGTRAKVDALSKGRLGYLHIRSMNWPNFEKFEAELYKVGHGKDGLVIDVRENGGGFITDHLLTCLTQPKHAITVGRGGGPGYPQGRLVYARWDKPIVVLCNQNSFSNAEIFSHAIKTLGRGKLVGVPTTGGVISTTSARIMDLGSLRVPMRGWYLAGDGKDMELNGCVPDVVLWPKPTEIPSGIDRQLEKAVELLLEDVEAARPPPKLESASKRRR